MGLPNHIGVEHIDPTIVRGKDGDQLIVIGVGRAAWRRREPHAEAGMGPLKCREYHLLGRGKRWALQAHIGERATSRPCRTQHPLTQDCTSQCCPGAGHGTR